MGYQECIHWCETNGVKIGVGKDGLSVERGAIRLQHQETLELAVLRLQKLEQVLHSIVSIKAEDVFFH